MNNIVDLDVQRPHYAGSARCRSDPEHKWAAVVPIASNPFALECPYCKQPGILSGYLFAGGLDAEHVQVEYEKLIAQANFANALLAAALHQATDGEQGIDTFSIEKTGGIQ